MRWVAVYLVPAAVFQSVIFGGAYGTGREVVEYITRYGGIDGLLALLAAGVAFGVCLALSFDLARSTQSFEYRAFISQLIGRGWVVYEILFVLILLLVIAVNLSASTLILEDRVGLPANLGRTLIITCVLVLIFAGRERIQVSMILWSALLAVVLAVFAVAALTDFAREIQDNLTFAGQGIAAAGSGLRYALYNLAGIPALMYCARAIESRREAWIAGFLAGLFGVLPAVLFHGAFLAHYPGIIEKALPTYELISRLSFPGLLTAYIIVLIAMIIHTVTGMLLGFNERIDQWWLEMHSESPPRWVNAAMSAFLLAASLFLAEAGIVALIARGYAAVAWLSLVVFAIPLLVVSLRGSVGTARGRRPQPYL